MAQLHFFDVLVSTRRDTFIVRDARRLEAYLTSLIAQLGILRHVVNQSFAVRFCELTAQACNSETEQAANVDIRKVVVA